MVVGCSRVSTLGPLVSEQKRPMTMLHKRGQRPYLLYSPLRVVVLGCQSSTWRSLPSHPSCSCRRPGVRVRLHSEPDGCGGLVVLGVAPRHHHVLGPTHLVPGHLRLCRCLCCILLRDILYACRLLSRHTHHLLSCQTRRLLSHRLLRRPRLHLPCRIRSHHEHGCQTLLLGRHEPSGSPSHGGWSRRTQGEPRARGTSPTGPPRRLRR
jgi:hypothetical protein